MYTKSQIRLELHIYVTISPVIHQFISTYNQNVTYDQVRTHLLAKFGPSDEREWILSSIIHKMEYTGHEPNHVREFWDKFQRVPMQIHCMNYNEALFHFENKLPPDVKFELGMMLDLGRLKDNDKIEKVWI